MIEVVPHTKACTRCGETKPVEDFSPRPSRSKNQAAENVVQSRCKKCCAELAAKWRAEHPEEHRARLRKRYAEQRDVLLARTREWRKKNPEYVRERSRRWNESNVEKVAAMEHSRKLRKFGLTEDQFAAMRCTQRDCCAICGKHASKSPKGTLHIDHDHDTGVVRQLLCHYCNLLIGLAGDSAERLGAAIRYLERHGATDKRKAG